MNNFVKKFRQMAPVISMIISQVLLLGCKDEDSKEYIEGQIPETEVAAYIAQMNQDVADMQQLADGKLRVLTYFPRTGQRLGNGAGERSYSKDLSRGREKRKKGNSHIGD